MTFADGYNMRSPSLSTLNQNGDCADYLNTYATVGADGVKNGWVGVSDTWLYASATTITVPTDARNTYSVGMKIRLTQTTTKYFYITGVDATTLTVSGGSDYTVANAAISAISYSVAANPFAFPHYFNFTPSPAKGAGGSWTSMTPSAITARFGIVNKTMYGYINMRQVSVGTPGTDISFTLPVAPVIASMSTWYENTSIWGGTVYCDSTTGHFYRATAWGADSYLMSNFWYFI